MKHNLLLFVTALLLGIQSHAQTGVAINNSILLYSFPVFCLNFYTNDFG